MKWMQKWVQWIIVGIMIASGVRAWIDPDQIKAAIAGAEGLMCALTLTVLHKIDKE